MRSSVCSIQLLVFSIQFSVFSGSPAESLITEC